MKKLPSFIFGSMIILLIFSFISSDFRSGYRIPREARSLAAADLDNDSDLDVFAGHNLSSVSGWSGLSVVLNTGAGYFQLTDSLFVDSGAHNVGSDLLDGNDLADIFYIHRSDSPLKSYAGIIYDFGASQFTNSQSVLLTSGYMADLIRSGDIDADGDKDLVFACYEGKKWGFTLNEGQGIFSSPVIHDLSYLPQGFDVADLNGDSREDIVIGGSYYGGGGITEIFYSLSGGFQNDSLTTQSSSVHISDMDHDGDNDVVCLNDVLFLTTIRIFENTGTQDFISHIQDNMMVSSYSSILSDLNNDNLPDLLVLPGSLDDIYIFMSAGNCELNDEARLAVAWEGETRRDIASGDFDGNGYNDIALIRDFPDDIFLSNLLFFFNDGSGNFNPDPLSIEEHLTEKADLFCFPNPFHEELTITVNLQYDSRILIEVIDIQGNVVVTLFDGYMDSGKHNFKWNCVDTGGKSCPAGIYFVRLIRNGKSQTVYKTVINISL